MSLLENLLIVQAFLHALRLGTHAPTQAGMDAMCERVDHSVDAAERLLRLLTPGQLEQFVGQTAVAAVQDEAPGNIILFPGVRYARRPQTLDEDRERDDVDPACGEFDRMREQHRRLCEEAAAGMLGPRGEGDVA